MFKRILSALLLVIIFFVGCKEQKKPFSMPEYNDALVQKIRTAAMSIPGELPVAINYLKYAASIRKWKDIIEGGSDDPCTMARTAFQVEYPDGWIMVDAGMDKVVHHFFEKEKPQPFDAASADLVARAVQKARLVVVTHEHGDHVAGVIHNVNNTIPPKTILTREQANTLINHPQMPEIKLNEQKSKEYLLVDFENILPIAPGMVLIKAPGHTPGEIMVYAQLQNGKEYIFTGDVTWCFKAVQEAKQKPESERSRLHENTANTKKQVAWLNKRFAKDNMIILVSHDDIMLPQYAAQGLIHNTMKIQ